MYGTIARIRMKPGMDAMVNDLLREFENRKVPGFIAEYLYRLDQDPDQYMIAVVFKDRESYVANASSPEQDALYRRLAAAFDGEPEWYDGEIVSAIPERIRLA